MSTQYERGIGLSGMTLPELRALRVLRKQELEDDNDAGRAGQDLYNQIGRIESAIRFWEDILKETKKVGGKL